MFASVSNIKKFLIFIVTSIFFWSNISVAAVPITSFSNVVEKTMSAVVNISTTQKVAKKKQGLDMDNPYDVFRELFEREFGLAPRREDNGQMRNAISLGSGFIVDASGYIVTNNHVIDDADEINVTLSGDGGQTYKAKVIGKDPKTDLAVLKIDAGVKLPFLKFGDSDDAKVGDLVLVIGNPFGLGGSVSSGIVSAKARNINSGHYDDFIQTDAAINVGNSGGPMLNIDGEAIGVNSIILSPSRGNIGIGFAIPSNMVQYVFKQLKEKGKIVRGQLGITIQDLEKGLADGLDLKGIKGALVSGIMRGSAAEDAGVKIGDVVTKFNGKSVTSSRQLPRMVGEMPLNSKVELEIFRDGKTLRLPVVIKKAKDENEDAVADEDDDVEGGKSVFGMQVQAINANLIKKFGLKHRRGVVVVGVSRGSLASLVGIKPGDVVLSVNKKDINLLKDFDNMVASIKKSGKGVATFLIARNDSTFFVSLEDN